MLEILLATNNFGKVKEIKDILNSTDVKILTMKDFPNLQKVEEDGKNYQEIRFLGDASGIILFTLKQNDSSGTM